jgi:hypothetical protein
MTTLGILTCEILELEFAYLLKTDQHIERITIVEDQHSQRLIEALGSAGTLNVNRITKPQSHAPGSHDGLEVLVSVLELALHNRKRTLQQGLIEAARNMGPVVDALLLGYGLCGNALEKPEELLAEAGVPVFIPMDEDHPVDDCVGLIIGGRNEYYGEQCKIAGTFFMIPGWTVHWKRMFEQEFGNITPDMARRLFKHYERSLLIPTPVMSQEEMQKNADAFSQMFGFRTEYRPGTMHILNDTWQRAKGFLSHRPD